MDSKPIDYTKYKELLFFPYDRHRKYGRIINVDSIGITYEVTRADQKEDCGTYFVSHGYPFIFEVIEA